MKIRRIMKSVRAAGCGLAFVLAFVASGAFAGTLTVPTVRHYGYVNGTLNLALIASDEVKASGATVEVQSSTDNGATWTALIGDGSIITAFDAWTIDNGGTGKLTLTDYHWKSAASLASDIQLRYRLVNGDDSSDWSEALTVTRSVAAKPKSVTAATGSDTVSCATDGDLSTFFAGATPSSIVYDFGKAVSIGEIHLAARLGEVCRLRTTKIECANASDFSDAQTLVEFVNYKDVCAKMGISYNSYYNVIFSDISVASFALDEPVSARYFRIGRPTGPSWNADLDGNKSYADRDDGGMFNFSEVEFSLADPEAVEFDAFVVGLDAMTPIPYTNRTPVVSWNVGDTHASSFTVERGTSAEGPFYEVSLALAASATSWSDATALVGVTYYYRVKALTVEAEPRAFYSAVVAYTPDRRLERDAADLTKLRTGVALIADNANTFWRGPVTYAFDGKTSTMPCTYTDNNTTTAWNNWQNPYVGVNLGENCRVTGCLVISAVTSDWWGNYFSRINTVNLYGTANSAGYYNMGVSVDCRWPTDPNGSFGRTELAQIRDCVRSAWKYFSVTNVLSYRSVYLQNPNPNDNTAGLWAACTWAGNVSEFGIFGYSDAEREENYASLVTAPTIFTAVNGSSGVETAWNAGNNAAGYRIQRRPGGSSSDEAWADVSGKLGSDVHAFTDTSVAALGAGAYEYRVVALDGFDVDAGYSASTTVFAYPMADGTGLRASLVWPFLPTDYEDSEAVRSSSVASPSVQFAAGMPRVEGIADSTNGVRVVYEGTVVIPADGSYQFRAVGTDGAALMLDEHFILNEWNAAAASRTTASAAMELTAGEHAFRFDTWQDTGDRAMVLEWSIDGTAFAPVPATQLRPAASAYAGTVTVPLAKGGVETWKVRTFGQKELGFAASDTDAKSLTVAGYDLTGYANGLGQTAVFKKFKGCFDVSVKIDLPGSPDNPGTKGIANADADTVFFLTARTGFGTGTIGYGPYAEWYGWRGANQRLGVGAFYKTAMDWGPGASGDLSSLVGWWNFKPSDLAVDDAHDTWLRLRLVRAKDESGKTVFSAYYRKGSTGDWNLFSKWTDTDGIFGKEAYICLGASRKAHASLSADTTRFLVREISCKSICGGTIIIVR